MSETEHTFEELRRLLEGEAAGLPALPGDLDPEELWSAVHGELDEAATRRWIERSIEDPAVARVWRLALDWGRGELAADPRREGLRAPAPEIQSAAFSPQPLEESTTAPMPAWKSPAALGLAAALFIACALFLFHRPFGGVSDSALRQSSSLEVTAVTQSQAPREHFLLVWEGPENAVYDLSLTTEETLEEIVSVQGLEQTEYLVPAAALADFESGEKFLWSVIARTPDGKRSLDKTFVIVLE